MSVEQMLLDKGWTKTKQLGFNKKPVELEVWKLPHWEKTVSADAPDCEKYYYATKKRAYGVQMKLNNLPEEEVDE